LNDDDLIRKILILLRKDSTISSLEILKELPKELKENLTYTNIENIISDLCKQGTIKRFSVILNPRALEPYGYKVYLITLDAVGFIHPLEAIRNILSQPRWQNKVSDYSVLADIDFIFRLIGTKTDCAELTKLFRPYARTMGVMEVDKPSFLCGFPLQEVQVKSFFDYKEILEKLQANARLDIREKSLRKIY
jgi:DNA-binding Lrp family transcriptional regulator